MIIKTGNGISCSNKTALLRFGMVADIQYADSDNRPAWYNPTKTRYYRNSLQQVRKAFQHWEQPTESATPVSFILQLGDIIDALNTAGSNGQAAIRRTLDCFLNNPRMPTLHTVGNHELYNFTRPELSVLFEEFLFQKPNNLFNVQRGSVDATALYYTFQPMKGVRFVSLDTYEISVLGHDGQQQHPNYRLAADILRQYHGHDDCQLWDSDDRLTGLEKRFQSSNGAVGARQLQWLEAQLTDADAANELVVIFGHGGLHPASCGPDSLVWNYDQLVDCFNRHPSVLVYFNGHAHDSGHAKENHVHYVVLHGIIEADPRCEAFATVSIMDDRMVVEGRGVELNLTIRYQKSYSFHQNNNLAATVTAEVDSPIPDIPGIKIQV